MYNRRDWLISKGNVVNNDVQIVISVNSVELGAEKEMLSHLTKKLGSNLLTVNALIHSPPTSVDVDDLLADVDLLIGVLGRTFDAETVSALERASQLNIQTQVFIKEVDADKRDPELTTFLEALKASDETNMSTYTTPPNLSRIWNAFILSWLIECYLKLRSDSREGGNKKLEIDCLNLLALNCLNANRSQEALTYLREAVRLSREIGDKAREYKVLNSLGAALMRDQQYDESVVVLEESLVLCRTQEDKGFEATIMNNIGTAYTYQKQPELAQEYYKKSLQLQRGSGEPAKLFSSVIHFAQSKLGTGKLHEAIELLEEAMSLSDRLDDIEAQLQAHVYLGTFYYTIEEYEVAFQYFQKSVRMSRKAHIYNAEAVAVQNLAYTYRVLKDHKNAVAHFRKGVALYHDLADRKHEAHALTELGTTYYEMHNFTATIKYFRQARDIYVELDDQKKIKEVDLMIANVRFADPWRRFFDFIKTRVLKKTDI